MPFHAIKLIKRVDLYYIYRSVIFFVLMGIIEVKVLWDITSPIEIMAVLKLKSVYTSSS